MANNNNFVKLPNQEIKSSRSWFSSLPNFRGMFAGQRKSRTTIEGIEISIPVHNATNDMIIKVDHMEIEEQVDVGLIPGLSDYNSGHPVNISRLDRTMRIHPVPYSPLEYRRPAAIEEIRSEDLVQPSLTTQQSERQTLKYPKYASYLERLKSLKHSAWTPKEQRILAEEGFFCSPHHAQQAACFCCGLLVDSVASTRLKTHPIDSRSACAFYKHMTRGQNGSTTCFDREHGKNGWIPCQLRECLLCEWESKMRSELSAPETFAQLN